MSISGVLMGLRSILSRASSNQSPVAKYPPPRPDESLAIIGDIHGRDDLLGQILADIAVQAPDARVLCVGDVIDRGPASASVMRRLSDLGKNTVVLRGNHEQMMIDFLDDPIGSGARWLRNGGAATLGSFGIPPPGSLPDADMLLRAHEQMMAALSDGLGAWLRALPFFWRSGNVTGVHAGADPRTPIEHQDPQNLMWGHPGFGRRPRTDGVWVVHGHTTVAAPLIGVGTVAIDTGACMGGRLTAALISDGEIRFLSA